MTDLFNFDLIDPDAPLDRAVATSDEKPATELEQWAESQLSTVTGPLTFDIETGPLPEEHLRAIYRGKTLDEFAATCDKRWKADTVATKYEEYRQAAWQEFVGKAALSAFTGRVLLIGTLADNAFAGIMDDDEGTSLTMFWSVIENTLAAKQRIIGHNSNSFDLPFLVRRSWLLGVDVPREVRQGRYWNPLFTDTMDEWQFHAKQYTSLNDLAAAFGVGQKTEGVHGRDFHKLWFGTPEERQRAIVYCEQDVRLTAAIAAKMGLV